MNFQYYVNKWIYFQRKFFFSKLVVDFSYNFDWLFGFCYEVSGWLIDFLTISVQLSQKLWARCYILSWMHVVLLFKKEHYRGISSICTTLDDPLTRLSYCPQHLTILLQGWAIVLKHDDSLTAVALMNQYLIW